MNVIIVGGGQVGSYIARLLLSSRNTVTVVENRKSVLDKLKKELPENIVFAGSGTDPKCLQAAGIEKADVFVAVTGADESNLVASTLAKMEFGIPRVIARVNNPKNAWLFQAGMGVDVAVNQADLLAHLVVTEMDFKEMMTLLKINDGNYSIVQILTDSNAPAVSRPVKDLAIPADALLITIVRDSKTIIPNGETVIAAGDRILALTNDVNKKKVYSLFAEE